MTDIVDPHVAAATRLLEAARAAKLGVTQPQWFVEASAAHDAATATLNKAKDLCDEECAIPEGGDQESAALAEFHHSSHRAVQETAYAEFARTGHALNPDVPQVPSNPAGTGVTQLDASVAVDSDVAS